MATPDPTDEQRHRPDDTELWNESYYFDWFSEDLSLGGYVRIGFYPNLQRVWYWACLVGPDRPLVSVIEHDVPLLASVSDRLVALEAGQVIAAGEVDEVLSSPLVIASYLGDDQAAVQRSDARRREITGAGATGVEQ